MAIYISFGSITYPLPLIRYFGTCGNTILQFAGRVYASACGAHGTELFYTNDTGVYMVQQRHVQPSRMQEYAQVDDRQRLAQGMQEHIVTLRQQRLFRYPEGGGVLMQGQGNTPKHTRAQLAFGVRDTPTQ